MGKGGSSQQGIQEVKQKYPCFQFHSPAGERNSQKANNTKCDEMLQEHRKAHLDWGEGWSPKDS